VGHFLVNKGRKGTYTPMSATAQSDRVGNITLEDINATTVDTVNRSSEINKRVLANPKRWNGRYQSVPLFTNNSTLGQSFKGTETFDTSIDYNTTPMTFYPTGYAQPVGVSVVERSINATPAGVIELYQNSYEYAQNSMITALGNMFYGYGTGNDFDGLGLIIDDGTNSSTYGGLSRTTYGAYINAGGSTGLVAASGGVIDLATLDSADDAATVSGDASETPNVMLCNQTVWSLTASLNTPSVMATYGAMGGGFASGTTGLNQSVNMNAAPSFSMGTNAFTYRGKPVVRDQKALSGKMYLLNEKYLTFKSLNLVGLNQVATQERTVEGAYDNVKLSAFQFRTPMMPVNALSEVGIFVLYGNMFDRNPNRNELVTGITTT
jgi:hypothetical protein